MDHSGASHRLGAPGVLHASRSSGTGKGWVVIPPMKFADLPSRVCVLRASALMIGALQRVTQVQPHDRLGALLWRVIAEELRGAQPELLEVPLPSSPRLLKAAQSVLTSPTTAISLDKIAALLQSRHRTDAKAFKQPKILFGRSRRSPWVCYAAGNWTISKSDEHADRLLAVESFVGSTAAFRQKIVVQTMNLFLLSVKNLRQRVSRPKIQRRLARRDFRKASFPTSRALSPGKGVAC